MSRWIIKIIIYVVSFTRVYIWYWNCKIAKGAIIVPVWRDEFTSVTSRTVSHDSPWLDEHSTLFFFFFVYCEEHAAVMWKNKNHLTQTRNIKPHQAMTLSSLKYCKSDPTPHTFTLLVVFRCEFKSILNVFLYM